MKKNIKGLNFNIVKWGVIVLSSFIILMLINPFGYNNMGYRQVVESPFGNKKVIFGNGVYLMFPGSTVTTYPNLVTIAYTKEAAEATVHQGLVGIRFMDATVAEAEVFVKYGLPDDEPQMLKLHEDFRNVNHLSATGLAPYTRECLKYSAQLMESEQHYSGGMSKLSGTFRDQLDNGQYIVDNFESSVRDSLTGELKKTYENKIRLDEAGRPVRTGNDIRDLGISVRTHNIINVDYEQQVEEKLAKKIEASTRESVSKQNLITAQQEELTAAAEGRKRLVEIEYMKKEEQTSQLVDAETAVKLAEKDKEKQKIALEASRMEAEKIKALAEAEAYAKRRIMEADGSLEKKLEAYKDVQQMWANAFAAYQGNLVPQIQTGGGGNGSANAGLDFMQLMSMKAAKDLGLQMEVKK